MDGNSKIISLIILIIIVIIVTVVIFRSYYKTDEERVANQSKLYLGIVGGVIGIIVIAYLMDGGDAQEHGVRDSVRNWWRSKREKREAGQDAKRAAEREVKERQRDEKRESRFDEARGRVLRKGVKESGNADGSL